ncbi:MAG: DUF6580 family putative transport protein [Candidatus Andersenbacteria bacterium]|nr:hypothetical protein [bacterium]MDZ4225314.1 DUF6580 family putative transport protein [Candidatus Andersenbacteria bacterium]
MTINKKLLSVETWLILILVGGSMILRLVPHVPNVAPIAAVALLSGALLKRPWALLVPLIAMFASDLLLGFYEWPTMAAVYGSFALTVWLGTWLRERRRALPIIGASLASSIIFYLATNLAVWRFSGYYPLTGDGLILSYYYAIPFFRYNLLGNLAYTGVLFVLAEWAPYSLKSLLALGKHERLGRTVKSDLW